MRHKQARQRARGARRCTRAKAGSKARCWQGLALYVTSPPPTNRPPVQSAPSSTGGGCSVYQRHQKARHGMAAGDFGWWGSGHTQYHCTVTITNTHNTITNNNAQCLTTTVGYHCTVTLPGKLGLPGKANRTHHHTPITLQQHAQIPCPRTQYNVINGIKLTLTNHQALMYLHQSPRVCVEAGWYLEGWVTTTVYTNGVINHRHHHHHNVPQVARNNQSPTTT